MVQFLSALIYFLLVVASFLLICLVLIQRGKGGGLAGAFGGVGGSSAFGTKAGDVFTRTTMILAGIWIALNMVYVILSNQRTSEWGDSSKPGSASQSTFTPPADKVDPANRPAGMPPATNGPGGPAAANGADALAPGNMNRPAPSPLGTGGAAPASPAPPTGTPTTGAPKAELPADPFGAASTPATSPVPVGSPPSGGGGNPKPSIHER